MGSSRARVLVAVAAIAAAVVLFVVLSADDDSTTTTTAVSTTTQEPGDGQGGSDKPEKPAAPEVPTIEVKDGQPVGGVQELAFPAGEDIRFKVRSDTAAEVHFHGYDIEQEVEAGGQVGFDIPADIEGVFEVELEETATPIAEISVEP